MVFVDRWAFDIDIQAVEIVARNVVCKLGNKLGSLRLTEEIEISLLKRLVGRGRATADRNENLHPTGMSLCDQSFILPLERWWRKKSPDIHLCVASR